MQIHDFSCGPYGTKAYLLENKQKECIIIDAPPESFDLMKSLWTKKGLKPLALIVTHGHWDHILDAWKFREEGIPLFAHPEGESLISDPESMAWFAPEGLEFTKAAIDQAVSEGPLTLGGFSMEFFSVPGHCPGSLAIYLPVEKICFSGDLIFQESVGRVDLPGGNGPLLSKSIKECILNLPGDTRLFPGHGPETSVDHEKHYNPFIR